MKRPEIWAIGGGKGGTGKSFLSCSIGLKLSKENKKTIVIDGDLGGSNIHSFFGRDKIKATLSDFFEKRSDLNDIVSESGFSKLKFVAGDIRSVNPATIPYFSRTRFYRDVRRLDADVIIIDLGAGSVLNTIDTFLIADRKIVVTTPEITSIENMYLFIKKVLIRRLSDLYLDRGYGKIVKQFWKKRGSEVKINTFAEFIEYLRKADQILSEEIDKVYSNIKFNVVLNQVKDRSQIKSGMYLNSVIKNHFKVDSGFSGYIDYNNNFGTIFETKEPISEILKHEKLYGSVSTIVKNIIDGKNQSYIS